MKEYEGMDKIVHGILVNFFHFVVNYRRDCFFIGLFQRVLLLFLLALLLHFHNPIS